MEKCNQKMPIDVCTINIINIIRRTHYSLVSNFLCVNKSFVNRESNNKLPPFYNLIICCVSRCNNLFEPFVLLDNTAVHRN